MLLSRVDSARRRGARRPAHCKPLFDLLEGRQLMAPFTPAAGAADGAANSLRAAIVLSNINGQDNTIVLQAGVYHLTTPNLGAQENSGASGDLDLAGIGHTITIVGAGAGITVIDGGGLDRVFQVMSGVTADIRDLTIQNGLARDDGDAGALPFGSNSEGGGILNQGTAQLTGVVIQGCSAVGGAGQADAMVLNDALGQGGSGGGIQNSGSMTLDACIVRDNKAIGGQGGDTSGVAQLGGAASGGGIGNSGTMTIRQSAIVINTAIGGAGGDGGHFFLGGGFAGSPGTDASGGGLFANGTLAPTVIIDSTIADNTAVGGAGGNGSAGASGGPIGLDGGPGGFGAGAQGGGFAAYSPITVENSTIAANKTVGGSGGAGGAGGLGYPVSGNPGPSGQNGSAAGGGIWAPGTAIVSKPLTSISSIIADNDDGGAIWRDAYAAFAAATNSLLGDATGTSGFGAGVNGNLVGVDPGLAALSDNGGPTPTLALLPGSPAIDRGANPLNLVADQRGFLTRSVGGVADMGAYESGAVAPPNGAGVTPSLRAISVKVVKVKGHRQVRVFDAGTNALKFAVYPFGKRYRGGIQVMTADLNGDGVDDLIARRPLSRKKFLTKAYSGVDGTPLVAKTG
jgi:hypothetical protein